MSDPIGPIFDMVSVDTETTGLNPNVNEIVEISAIEFNSSGLIGRKMTQLCRPIAGYIPAEVTQIHGISYDMVKDCPTYLNDKVREKFAEFIGDRTVIGHNVIAFDSGFIRINFKSVKDTLTMCRAKYAGGNKLKSACKRVGISWDDTGAHRSEYDALKCIELYCKMVAIERKETNKIQAPLFSASEEIKQIYSSDVANLQDLSKIDISNEIRLGIIPSESDKKLIATQTYSYSRINLFNQCAFKWYMIYIKGFKEPDREYFQTGKICHKVAELSGEWCYRELFKNKVIAYISKTGKNIEFDKSKYSTLSEVGYYVFDNPKTTCIVFPEAKHIADLIYIMDQKIDSNSYEKPSMPDMETYNNIIETSINKHKCENADVIREVKSIMNRFYGMKDFSLMPGDLTLTEKKMAFDKDWKSLNDFFAKESYFRGVIDVISYYGDYVVITDYKSSRKMMTLQQVKEDHQTMVYLLLVYKFLPKGSFSKVIIRIEYIRFGQVVEYEVNNPEEVANRALGWINTCVQNIEKEMLKNDGTAFQPIRNEFCHACFLGEDGKCPLFNKQISGKLDDPFACSVSTIDECVAAWKRIETNKAENDRLSKMCKSFLKLCSDPVVIDKKAKLDFYLSKHREFDSKKTTVMLLNKNLDMSKFIHNYSISPSELSKILENNDITLTDEEIDSISIIKTKSTFDAFTEEEAKGKGFINP